MDNISPDALYGLKAVAAHVGMTFRQAKHRAATGELPTFKMGKTVCASRASLDAWLVGLAAQSKSANL